MARLGVAMPLTLWRGFFCLFFLYLWRGAIPQISFYILTFMTASKHLFHKHNRYDNRLALLSLDFKIKIKIIYIII